MVNFSQRPILVLLASTLASGCRLTYLLCQDFKDCKPKLIEVCMNVIKLHAPWGANVPAQSD